MAAPYALVRKDSAPCKLYVLNHCRASNLADVLTIVKIHGSVLLHSA